MTYTKIIRSGNTLEVYEYEKSIRKTFYRTPPKRDRDNRPFGRRGDNARRSKRNFQRIVQSNLVGAENPAFLTLTFVQSIDYQASYKALYRFLQALRWRVGPALRYIAVPEFQKRGAVHYHLLVWGLPHELPCTGRYIKKGGKTRFLHTCPRGARCERATRRLQSIWLRGFVDIVRTNGHPAIAGYLSKYMSKSLLDPRLGGKKAHFTSRNTLRPLFLGSELPYSDLVELGFLITPGEKTVMRHGMVFKTMFLGECLFRRFSIEIPPLDRFHTVRVAESTPNILTGT